MLSMIFCKDWFQWSLYPLPLAGPQHAYERIIPVTKKKEFSKIFNAKYLGTFEDPNFPTAPHTQSQKNVSVL